MVLYPNVTFGDYLRTKLDDLQVRPAELARRTGMTKQNLSRIINNIPHWQTGALPRVTVETVDKIAKALGIDQNEARKAAGFAPVTDGVTIRLGDDATINLFGEISPEEAAIVAQEMALAYRIIMAQRREEQAQNDKR